MSTVEPNLGIYENEGVALAELVRRLVDGLNPQQVFLFGSRARRDHRPDSDFDFLVVTNVEDGENGRDWGWVRKPLRGSGVGCDVVPVRIDDFEAELHSGISMIPSIMHEAVKVYDVKEGFRIPGLGRSGTSGSKMFA
jgi:predicted nucleotidyltransferase